MTNRRHNTGFTIMEVLIAMGIFLVGIVAIAAVFPTGIAVQRNTVDDLNSQIIANNARSVMVALAGSSVDQDDPFTYHHETAPASRSGTLQRYSLTSEVQPLPLNPESLGRDSDVGVPTGNDSYAINPDFLPLAPEVPNMNSGHHDALYESLPLAIRSYPSSTPDAHTFAETRRYRWFPFIKIDAATSTRAGWRAFVFITRHEPGTTRPTIRYFLAEEALDGSGKPFSPPRLNLLDADGDADQNVNPDLNNDGAADFIQPGDIVMTANGLVHRVILADANTVTVSSPTLSLRPNEQTKLYFGVLVPDDPSVVAAPGPLHAVRGLRSPIVRIDEFNLPVMDRQVKP